MSGVLFGDGRLVRRTDESQFFSALGLLGLFWTFATLLGKQAAVEGAAREGEPCEGAASRALSVREGQEPLIIPS